MATMTNSQRVAELRKKRKEEEDKKKSSSTASQVGNLNKQLMESKTDFFNINSVEKLKENNKDSSTTTIGNKNSDKIKTKRLQNTINFDTFASDLASMGTTISNIYNGWQTAETMNNTRSSIESMQKRINAYQEYQKLFGGTDISDIASGYSEVLSDWDNRTKTYAKYKSKDEYDSAMKAAEDALKRREGMKTANLEEHKAEIDRLEGFKSNDYFKEFEEASKIKQMAKSASGRNGYVYNPKNNKIEDRYNAAKAKLDEFLASEGYADTEALQKDIVEKTQYLNQAQVIQDRISLENEIREDADFAKYVSKGEALGNEKEDGWLVSDMQRKNQVAYLRNNPEAMKTFEEAAKAANGASWGTPERLLTQGNLEYKAAKYGTVEQLQNYYAYLGKGEAEKAKKYLEAIEEDLNYAMGTAQANEQNTTTKRLLYSINAGLDQWEQNTLNLFNTSNYIPQSPTQVASGQVREELYDVGPEFLGSSLGQIVYDVGTTTANMAPSILASALTGSPMVGIGVMGVSAAGGAYQEKLNQGWDKGQARVYSTAIGIAEGAMQYALGGIGKLGGKLSGKSIQAMATGIDNAFARFFATMSIKGAGEGVEESLQEVIAPFIENLALGYAKNNWSDVDLQEVAYSGMLGALSTGLLEGGGTAVNVFGENHTAKNVGASIRGNERAGDVFDIASLTPQESDAYNLYTAYANKGVNADNASDLQLGRLLVNSDKATQEVLGSNKSTLAQKDKAKDIQKRISEISKENALDKDTMSKIEESINTTKSYRDGLIETGLESAENSESHKLALELQAKVKNGEDVSSKDLEKLAKANDNAIKLEELAETMSAEDKGLFLEQYDGEMDVGEYHTNFTYVNTLADNAVDVSEALAKVNALTPSQVGAIYNAKILANDAKPLQVSLDNLKAKYKGSAFIEGNVNDVVIDYKNRTTDGSKVNWKDLTSRQQKAIRFAKAFAKATGVNIMFTRSKVVNGEHKGKNGSYIPETNTITLDVYAGRIDASTTKDAIIPTLSHELTHWMKNKAITIYNAISEDVMQTLAASKGLSRNDLIASEIDRIKKAHPEIKVTSEYAMDELVARACEDMLSHSNQARKLLAKMSVEEQQTFKGKVKETLENLIGWVNELLNYYKSDSDEAETLREYKKNLKAISKMWDEMLVSAIEANQALQNEGITGEELAKDVAKTEIQTDMQYSIREEYANEIDDWVKDGKPNGESFVLGTTGDVLQGLGAIESDIYMLSDKINEILSDHPEITIAEIKKIPQILDDPVLVLKSKKIKSRLVIFGSVKAQNGKPILVALDLRPHEKGFMLNDMQKVNSAYTKTETFNRSAEENGRELVKASEILYVDKKRTTHLLSAIGFYMPITCNQSGYIGSISYEGDNVKIKGEDFSKVFKESAVQYADRDSSGKTLTKEQAENEDIRFSMRENVEETKELVAVHNLSPEKLLKTLRLGGLPMPSIAITRARDGYNNFGAISLVFNKDTIDPTLLRSNKVYSGDAWTPTYPQIAYKVNEEVQKNIKKKIDALVPSNVQTDLGGMHLDAYNVEHELNRHGDLVPSYRYNTAMKYAFLKDYNVNIELPTKEEPFYRYGEVSNSAVVSFANKLVEGLKTANSLLEQHSSKLMADTDLISGIATVLNEEVMSTIDEDSEAYHKLMEDPLYKPEDIDLSTVLEMLEASRKYFHSAGKAESRIDYREATKKIDDYFDSNSLEKEYEYWLKKLFTDIVDKEGIRNNKDLFTPSGNRRSFEALHYEHNLENVIKAMKESGDKGIGGFGGGNIFGAATKEYGSIDDIKADARKRMQQLPESKYDKIKRGFSDRLLELASSLPIHKDSFSALDDAANMLIEAVSKFKTKSGMANYLRTESKGWANYNDYIVDDLIQLVNEIRQMPVGYFEAKPQRVVGFNEIKAVIVPEQSTYEDDLTEIKNKLEEHGIPILEYEYGDNNSRIKVLNSLEGVQFSDRMTETVYDKMGETKRLEKETARLKKDLGRLRERLSIEGKVTGGTAVLSKDTDAVARHIRKIADSTFDTDKLSAELKDLYTYVRESSLKGTWNDDAIFAKAYELAEGVLTEAKPKTTPNDYAKFLLREIRSKRIRLSDTQIQEAKNVFGDKYRNAFWGKITIANDGISLDSQWQEWASTYPDFFKADVNEGDQITELHKIYDDLRDVSEIVQEYDAEEQTRWLAEEIINKCWTLPIRFTIADKYDAQIKALNFEHRQAMKEMRDDREQKLKEQHQTDKARYKELVQKVRDRKDAEIAEAKKLGKERLDKYKENAERKTKIQSITANALTLNKWLTKNSKEEHIHEAMKAPVVELLQAIDFSSKQLLGMPGSKNKGTPTQKDISLSKALGKVKDMLVSASNTKGELVELYGHGLDEEIAKLADSVDAIMGDVGDNEFVLNKMSLEELNSLDKVVSTIKHAVTKLNKFHTINHSRGIANLSQESMSYLNSLGMEKLYKGLRGSAKKLLNWDNALPYYAFKRYGEGGRKVFEAFQNGWDKFAFHIKKIMDYANDTYTSKEVKEWEKDIKEFKIRIPATDLELADPNYTPEYQKVQITVPQIMSLYCLQKREQAKGHILGGGIRVANIETKKGEIISQPDGVTLTVEDISTIISSLTSRQIEVADKLQMFMNTICSDWGNEVSMLRFGYKAFGEENYFPIQSDKNNLEVDNEETRTNSLFALLNMSFAKSTIDGANNRIVIGNIFDIFAQHTSDMAKYNALALPVLDAFKWYNYTEKEPKGNGTFITTGVKQSLEKAFGKDGVGYFTTFLKDMNGEKEVSRDTLGKHFFTSAKVASVAANLRVMFLQPTSYVRANAIINNLYLTKALIHKPKIKMAEKYCGMALWKSMGYYDTNIQKGVEEQIKHNKTWKDKTTNFTLKGAEWADKLTWGYLWNACELEVRKTRTDLKVGSEEFYQTIGERLREIIYATQVVDSTMTRSQMMRSSQVYDKMLTAFASEPTLAYNMVQDAYMGYKLDERQMGKKEAIKKNGKEIARVITAYTLTNALAALVESGFDAFRDDEDEEMDLAEFMKIYLSNFAYDMSLTAKIPYVKELVSILQGFSSSRTDTQWMQSLGYFLKGLMKLAEGKGSVIGTVKHGLRSLSYLSGLPFYNVFRDLMATLDMFDIFTAEDLEEMFEDFIG